MKITDDVKLEINNLYYDLKSYAAVARQIGCSAGTVKKYVDPWFKPIDNLSILHFEEKDIPTSPYDALLTIKNIADTCILSPDEKAELEELRKEILL